MCLCSSALLNIFQHDFVEKDAKQRKRTAAYDTGVKYDVGPARILTILCCNRPAMTWERTRRCQWNLPLPKKVFFIIITVASSTCTTICVGWCFLVCIQGVSQLLKQSDWAQIQDFK